MVGVTTWRREAGVYFLLPGETPDPGLLREHAHYRDRALDHWHHLTGGRGQLTTELP